MRCIICDTYLYDSLPRQAGDARAEQLPTAAARYRTECDAPAGGAGGCVDLAICRDCNQDPGRRNRFWAVVGDIRKQQRRRRPSLPVK